VLFDTPDTWDVFGGDARRPPFVFGVVGREPEMYDSIPDNYVRRPNLKPLLNDARRLVPALMPVVITSS
jgi:hypothetical protein